MLKNYEVRQVVEPGTYSPSATYKQFENDVILERATKTLVRKGMKIVLDEGVYIEIIFPDQDVSDFTTNDGSIIARLVCGNVSYMLTGDTTQKTERHLVLTDKKSLDSTVLKVAHHGSRTSSGEEFVRAVSPDFVVISAGKNNKYGHPHKETVDTFSKLKIPILGTYTSGTIVTKTDGRGIEIE